MHLKVMKLRLYIEHFHQVGSLGLDKCEIVEVNGRRVIKVKDPQTLGGSEYEVGELMEHLDYCVVPSGCFDPVHAGDLSVALVSGTYVGFPEDIAELRRMVNDLDVNLRTAFAEINRYVSS